MTSTVPAAWAGEVAVIEVDELTEKAAGTPPNSTAIAPLKFEPEMLTEVPPALLPVVLSSLLSVRRVHSITEQSRPEFVHVPKFGSPQYSDAFVDWLVGEFQREPQFFARAKKAYLATRPRRRAASSP